MTAEDVARAASFGDPVAVELLQAAGRRIGAMLASVVNFFNPSLIVIGGGVAQSGDVLLASIRETVYGRSLPLATRDLLIQRSSLGGLAGVIGASSMVVDQLFARDSLARWAGAGEPSGMPDVVLASRLRATIRHMAGYEIAQLNVGRAGGPRRRRMADFWRRLDEINALAERSPGFVWRLKGDNNNATGLLDTDDPLFIVNLTVWRSIDELWAFTYATHHNQLFKRRFEWFERSAMPTTTMWWQPAGTIPDIHDALRRLRHLSEHGPTPEAFTLKQRFPPPDEGSAGRHGRTAPDRPALEARGRGFVGVDRQAGAPAEVGRGAVGPFGIAQRPAEHPGLVGPGDEQPDLAGLEEAGQPDSDPAGRHGRGAIAVHGGLARRARKPDQPSRVVRPRARLVEPDMPVHPEPHDRQGQAPRRVVVCARRGKRVGAVDIDRDEARRRREPVEQLPAEPDVAPGRIAGWQVSPLVEEHDGRRANDMSPRTSRATSSSYSGDGVSPVGRQTRRRGSACSRSTNASATAAAHAPAARTWTSGAGVDPARPLTRRRSPGRRSRRWRRP